ncbi:MAG: thymidine kinase [Bacteroidetes bacterium]|nr:thymidine kinase [Bacteroidota bacterium]
MFLEFHNHQSPKRGSIEVVCGSMFSGKTEELIRRLRRAQFAKQKVEIFKPKIDTRYDEQAVVSHNDTTIMSTPVPSSENILLLAINADVVGIDEAQFFDMGLIQVCNTLANNGVRVIVAGLDMDFTGKPFGPVPHLMAIAEHVDKVHAICVQCGSVAQFSFRKTTEKSLVVLGETDRYEPLCRTCYNSHYPEET